MARKTGSSSEKTGPLIRAAAVRLFAQSGFSAVSMRQIAKQVGLQAGALYLYTPDKQTLLFDLMRDHMQGLLSAWQKAGTAGTPLERLENFARFHTGFHLDMPEMVFISYMELRSLTPENFTAIETLRKDYEAGLELILTAGIKDGSFQVGDAKVTTRAIIALLNGVNVWYRPEGRLSSDRIVTLYWEMVRNLVTGRG